MAKLAANKLPAPRMQLRWEKSPTPEYQWQCHYELVILLGEHDIRREVYKNGRQLKKKMPRELAITMKPPTMRSGNGKPPCGAELNRYADPPFRDGAHAMWDAIQLGDPPIFVIAPDGKAFQVEYKPDELRAIEAKREHKSKGATW